MENKEEEMEIKELIFIMFIWMLIIGVGGLFVFHEFISETTKQERKMKSIFIDCIEQQARNYCESLNKTFNDVAYSNINVKEFSFLQKPIRMYCKDERVCCETERYYFIDDEINYCLNNLK